MALRPRRGLRRAALAVRARHPDRGAHLARRHVQRRNHSGAALRRHDRPRRPLGLDRRVAGAEGERAMTTIEQAVARPPEQTRARYPEEEGYVERDGVRLFY